MTTFVLKSDLDAAHALLDLQGDPHEHYSDHIGNKCMGVDHVEKQESIDIFGTFIASRTHLTPPGTPKKNDNYKSNTAKENIAHDAGTQTAYSLHNTSIQSDQLEIRDQVIQKLYTENEALREKIYFIKDAQSRETLDLSSDLSSSGEDFSATRRSYKTRQRRVTANTDSSSFGDCDSPNVRDHSELKDKMSKNTSRSSKSSNKTSNQEMVPLGDGNASVPARVLKHMDWNSYTNATRKLLTAVFSRKVLATHSLTGKPSPAFPDKPAKKKLDAALVNDIVQTVVEKCRVPENVIRTSITTKCADESKMYRTRQNKNKRKFSRKENRSPSSD